MLLGPFDFISSDVPAELQWAFGAVGVIAFLLAMHPILQAFVAPRLALRFSRYDVDGIAILRCHVISMPIKARWQRFLRLRRPVVRAISAYISISETGGKQLMQFTPEWARQDPAYMEGVSDIAPSQIGTFFNVAMKVPGEERLLIMDRKFREKELTELNQQMRSGQPVGDVVKRTLPKGIYDLTVSLIGAEVTRYWTVSLHNDGDQAEDAWIHAPTLLQ